MDREQQILTCSHCGEPFDFTEGFLSRQLDIDNAAYYCSSKCYEQSLQDNPQ
jgi:ribosomal protein L24E